VLISNENSSKSQIYVQVHKGTIYILSFAAIGDFERKNCYHREEKKGDENCEVFKELFLFFPKKKSFV
jgi:hypothetical protein